VTACCLKIGLYAWPGEALVINPEPNGRESDAASNSGRIAGLLNSVRFLLKNDDGAAVAGSELPIIFWPPQCD